MSPSRRHDLLAWAIPRMRRASELDSLEAEEARLLRCQAERDASLPVRGVRGFATKYSVVTEQLGEGAVEFASYVVTPRGINPAHTIVYVHGGGYVAGIDPFHLRYAARLASALGARVVLPDYPLTPAHDWSDSHEALVALTARWAADSQDLVLAGDSAGGGIALAVAQSLRDRGGPQPSHLLLLSPWVDLTTSAPETAHFSSRDPWLKLSKIKAYADWWAGRLEDRARPEVSPALGDLAGLPPTLMFCGTRDTLVAGCRLLAQRAEASDWDLTYVEAPDLIHVYPLLPLVPEARAAWRRTLEFLR